MFNKLKQTYLDVQKYYEDDADAASIEKNRYYIYYVMRPVSIPFTILSNWIGITPNQATLIGNFFIFIATTLLFIGSENAIAIMLLYNLYCIFDHVDGNLARINNLSSQFGKYYDGLSDHLPQKPFVLGLGVYAFYQYDNIIWVLIAFLAIFIEETYVYVENRFNVINLINKEKKTDKNVDQDTESSSKEDAAEKLYDQTSKFRALFRILLKNRAIINFPILTLLFLMDHLALYLVIFLFSQTVFFLPRAIRVFLEAKKQLS